MGFDAEDRHSLGAALALSRFDWSEARVALLRRRWAEGLSASTIAKELGPGVTRCAVLGKVHRLKLVQPQYKRQHPRKERARKRPRAPRPTSRPRRSPSQLMEMFHALGLDALFGAPDTRTVHQHAGRAFGPACGLLELTAATCRWPVGEPDEPNFAFCGAAPLRRYPYCIAHCLIAYRPASRDDDSKQPAAEPARRQGRAA
jgi:GcrA cell cycle regulator